MTSRPEYQKRTQSTGSTSSKSDRSIYDPLRKYRNTSLTQDKPLTDKNRAAINPEVLPVLERIARGNGIGSEQLQTINRAASVSSLASDQSAVSTWHISRDAGYRNKLTLSHKRDIVSRGGFKGDLPASRENWYERRKGDPLSGPSGTKYDVDSSKIMFREGHYRQKEQLGDMPTYRKGSERDLRQAVKGLTFFDYFEDNPDETGNFQNLQTFTRYHPSKRSQREAGKKTDAIQHPKLSYGSIGSASASSSDSRGGAEMYRPFKRASVDLGELGGLDMLKATIKNSFGRDEIGQEILNASAIRQQYVDYQAMIKATAPSSEECRDALNYLMARRRYLSSAAKKRQAQRSGKTAKAAGTA